MDLTDEAVKYCVSQYTCKVASEGMERFVQSWNNHKIQGNSTIILILIISISKVHVHVDKVKLQPSLDFEIIFPHTLSPRKKGCPL